LGAAFNTAIDIWSAAVSLFELYAGKIMFPGRTNNEMLKFMIQTKGKFKTKLLKKSEFAHQHFNP
jgi:serine/threonine-protein kinase PRP4